MNDIRLDGSLEAAASRIASAASSSAAASIAPPLDDTPLARLSVRQRVACWALVVALFCFDTGPIWEHPWDIARLDRAIAWSYAPIPLLVAALLVVSRRFSLRAFFLDTLELTLLKYVTTFALALVLWEITPRPLPPAPLPPRHAIVAPVAPAPAPMPLDPRTTGDLIGQVRDARGLPIEGAWVVVDGGLPERAFPPPAQATLLVNDGAGVSTRDAVVSTGQRIEARASDGHLHTLVAIQGGATLFNVPLLAEGRPSALPPFEQPGEVTLRCNVHPGEPAAHLRVLAHPFAARTDGDGRFRLAGVPAGALHLTVLDDGDARAGMDVTLGAGAQVEVAIPVTIP